MSIPPRSTLGSVFSSLIFRSKYRSILVTGMGGGCDVFTAHALANSLRALEPVLQGGTRVSFGNCVGYREGLERHEKLDACLYQVKAGQALAEGDQGYGEVRLEESLFEKKDASFGPYLSVIHHKRVSSTLPLVSDVTKANSEGLIQAWANRFDLIVAVDNGGDSITGGIDFHGHVELGRDTQVSLALQQFQSTGKGEYLHVVMGPGCDGESSMEALHAAYNQLVAKGKLLDTVDLHPLLEETFARTSILGETRTPNIMYNANKLLLQEAKKNEEGEQGGGTTSSSLVRMEVPRGDRHRIPAQWLCSAWIFRDAPYCASLTCDQHFPCKSHLAGHPVSKI